MSAPRNTRRPNRPGPEVYRRRRIIALVLVAAIVIFVWWGIASIVNGISNLVNPPKDVTSTTAPAAEGAACAPGAIEIEALVANKDGVDTESFDPGNSPYFGYRITNTSTVDCTFDVGAATTFYTVTSGSETIWRSKDCADRSTLTAYIATLKAGETKTSNIDQWFKVKSTEGIGCDATQEPVITEGASYKLQAEVGGVISSNTVQFLLN
jgi:zona occludens toxin (predicted ATPase)